MRQRRMRQFADFSRSNTSVHERNATRTEEISSSGEMRSVDEGNVDGNLRPVSFDFLV